MYTYIVIDDESLMRKGVIKRLQPLADQLTCIGEAQDGVEALALIREKNPDIIITDMKMPVMDGTQLLPLLTEQFPEKRIIIISGFKDFDYMKHAINAQAVDYILKPFKKEDLQKSVLNTIAQLENKAAIEHQLISTEEKSEISRYDYDIQMLKNSILGYHTESYMLTSDKLKFINQTHNLILITLHAAVTLIEEHVQNFLAENGFGDLALFLQHTHHKNLGFLILFVPEHSSLPLEDLCHQVIRILNHMFDAENQHIAYGISRTHHSLTELHQAFQETSDALNSQKSSDSTSIYFYTDRAPDNANIIWDKSSEFLFHVEAGMVKQVQLLIEELFHYLGERKNNTLYDIKLYCFWLADETRHILSEYMEQVNLNSANSSMQNVISSMFSLKELKQYYIQFFTNITDILKKQSIYEGDDVVEKMQTYIKRHYQNKLTIEFLSSIFHMNRSYCSHLFVERTGKTFVSFLNEIRLEKARELLRNSDKKMYQIAKQVGYDNVKYFFRVFKKQMKMTPDQYRTQYGKKD